MSNNFFPLEYQIAVFPNNFKINDVGKVAAKLMLMADYFSPETIKMNPFDMSVPPEIERVNISDKDQSIKVSVSPSKVSFFWINAKHKGKFDEDFKFSEKKSLDMVAKVFGELGIDELTIKRVGFISTLIQRNDNPPKFIEDHLLQKKIENEINSADLRITYKIPSLETHKNCNLHSIFQSAFLTDDKDEKLVQIQLDVNTHQDDNLDWNFVNLDGFVKEVNRKVFKKIDPARLFSENSHGTAI